MKINDVEFWIALFVGDIESDNVEEHYFKDFYEFNKFVRENIDVKKYQSETLNYSLVEASNGNISGFSWTQEIKFEEFTDEAILEEIEAQRQYMADIVTLGQNVEENLKTIHYTGEYENYAEKSERLKDFAYVCPNCIREVKDCRCRHYPYYLIQIDRLILPIIRELNTKGYKTTGCCAGHLDMKDEFKAAGIYICFDKDYDFDTPIPDGAAYDKLKHSVNIIPKEIDYDSLDEFQIQAIWKLSDWAEMLFEIEEE